MDINQINEVLSNLYEYTLDSKFTKVATEEPRDFYSEGEESTKTDIYRLNIEDWHLKVCTTRDSYGDNPTITSIKFVKPVIKQITDFE